jgi:hypothetical protein
LLTIAGVVSVLTIFNTMLPAVARSGGAIAGSAAKIDDRIKSQIRIVHATGELDAAKLWQDTNSDGDFDHFFWVKNVGAARLGALEEIDVFHGAQGNFSRIPYVTDAGGAFPRWTFVLENDTEWIPTATLKIIIHSTAPCSPAPCSAPSLSKTYLVKVTTPSGVSDEHFYSL